MEHNDIKIVLINEWNSEKNEMTLDDYTHGSNKIVWWKCNKGHEWKSSIKGRYQGRGCPYCAGSLAIQGENDLKTLRPNIAAEWDYEKNGGLTPKDVTVSSSKKVYWKCKNGHSYLARIYSRTNLDKPSGCPYCSGRLPIQGKTDLLSQRPDVLEEWDYEKNNKRPDEYTVGSDKRVWWRCSKGHSYEATISHKTEKKPRRCPYCCGKRVIRGETDLLSQRPDLAIEWDYTRNKEVRPENVTLGSGKRVYWRCKNNHSYDAKIIDRARKDKPAGCPYCSRRRVVLGSTDLPSQRPDLMLEWDYTLNEGVDPQKVSISSGKKYYWKCGEGHSYVAKVDARVRLNTGCPVCSGRLPIKGETDLLTLRPDIAAEWDYEKNGGLTPKDVTVSSSKKVYWKCKNGHSYYSTISDRTRYKRSRCPYCAGKLAIQGENDLKTLRPDIAAEWDYDNNKGIHPEEYLPNSGKKVAWICKEGHKYNAIICDRTRRVKPTGCPYCANQKPIQGKNDLTSIRPDLVRDWDFERNRMAPEMFMPKSHKKVWWKCHVCGNRQYQAISKRASGQECPNCRN